MRHRTGKDHAAAQGGENGPTFNRVLRQLNDPQIPPTRDFYHHDVATGAQVAQRNAARNGVQGGTADGTDTGLRSQ